MLYNAGGVGCAQLQVKLVVLLQNKHYDAEGSSVNKHEWNQ